jgi:N-acetylglucosamine-6-phosphate deacetylase
VCVCVCVCVCVRACLSVVINMLCEHAMKAHESHQVVVSPVRALIHRSLQQGHILSPGFIDIQLNGGWGHDFSDPKDGDLMAAVKVCPV